MTGKLTLVAMPLAAVALWAAPQATASITATSVTAPTSKKKHTSRQAFKKCRKKAKAKKLPV